MNLELNPPQITPRYVTRPLSVLVPLIQKDLADGKEAADRAGMPFYRAAGEKLLEAKLQIQHGDFHGWVKRTFKISKQTASVYMRLASEGKGPEALYFSSLADFLRSRSKPRPTQRPPVDAEAVYQAELDRCERHQADCRLALQMLNAGYKALALQFHPDRGGSKEAMTRFNIVRERIRDFIRAGMPQRGAT